MADKTALDIELQDSNGNAIVSDKLEVTNQSVITSSVTVETELVPMRQVPLRASTFVSGEPAEGYELTGIELAEETVPVAARQEVLDALTELTTDSPLDITGATDDVSGYVRLRRQTGVENTLPTEIGVTAHIAEKQIERTIRQVPIQIEGLTDDKIANAEMGRTTIQLTGGYGFIGALSTEDIRLFVDVSGLEAGTYNLPVQVHIDNAPEFTCALASPQISVVIRNK